MSDPVRVRREGGILEVTLDRPKANAIDLATSRLMGRAFADFRDDPSLRVAVLRTAGDKVFFAGWDLKAAAGGDAVDGDYGVGGFGGLQELPGLNKPVIAAVHGLAMGGGFELALSCDLIYATQSNQFALPEVNAGTLADAATIKLPKRMPSHVAMELLLTGRWMGAEEAHRWGLVNEMLADDAALTERVWEVARQLEGSTRSTVPRTGWRGSRRSPRNAARCGRAAETSPTTTRDGAPTSFSASLHQPDLALCLTASVASAAH